MELKTWIKVLLLPSRILIITILFALVTLLCPIDWRALFAFLAGVIYSGIDCFIDRKIEQVKEND